METDDERTVPLELGTVGPPSADDDDAENSRPIPRWRLWTGLGAALVVGAVVGIVANNARNDAAEYAEVGLVRGTVDVEFGSPLSSNAQRLSINLVNTGPRELEILEVDVDGFTSVPNPDGEDRPVSVAPGEWVRVDATVESDCDTRPPGTLQVNVRTGSGERTVAVAGQPGDDQLIWAWQTGCDTAGGTGVFIGDTRTISADASGARIVLPVTNGADEPLTVTTMETTTPGFAMTTDPLPVDVEAGATVQVETVWTVTDCEAAARFAEATVAVNIHNESMDTRVSQPLDNTTLIELVRLSVRVCET
ncbi:hypothetical protein [Jiangella alkaliphila]|uniref:Uncharacterized protein n=1 Tax=Jiangella alkaliphila TaxID=419479 RepID=A0A1H2GQX6_9ACTN|nr:hypothetical protein [Jiangella alkaliphila]SDU22103.1 hypothetical protein SAMN04488563_0634 [Jiangella alkaliphila]